MQFLERTQGGWLFKLDSRIKMPNFTTEINIYILLQNVGVFFVSITSCMDYYYYYHEVHLFQATSLGILKEQHDNQP